MFEHVLDRQLLLLMHRLSDDRYIRDTFYLGGGTALALHLGHRKSEDIDLFTTGEFNIETCADIIIGLGGKINEEGKGTLHGFVDSIKVSLLLYPYPVLMNFSNLHYLNVAGMEDIACMKIIAVSQRSEKKDFFDMYEILKIMKPVDLKRKVLEKYGEKRINFYHILKSFFYFNEAESSPDPVSLNGTTWAVVKKFFIQNEKELTKGFLG